MIKITNLNKYYNKGKSNEIHVINSTSINLPDTGFVSILGNSGSGKTTLLNVIAGLDKATGEIDYGDFKTNKYSMKNIDAYRSKNIGYIFQNYNLLLEYTVFDNLKIALLLIGINDEEEINKRITYALKAVDMYKFRKKKAGALSGGQQQRVSIARALIKKSKFIIADEPTGNLDSKNAIEVMNILKAISKTSLVLMVTHNKELADHYSNLILEVKDGSIINNIENEALGYKSSNNDSIYLGDLEKEEFNNVTVYGNSEELANFKNNKIELIYHNGKLYFKNDNIKVLPNNINVLKGNSPKEENIDFEFDNSWYQDKSHKEHIFKRFFKNLARGYNNFRIKTKKRTFINLALMLVGFLIGMAVCNLANYSDTDYSNTSYSDDYYMVKNDSFDGYSDKLRQLSNEKRISDLIPVESTVYIVISKQVTVNFSASTTVPATTKDLSYGNVNLEMGRLPKAGEVLVSSNIARKLSEESSNTLNKEDAIGASINFFGQNYTISGITTGDNGFITLTSDDYYYQYATNMYELTYGRYYKDVKGYYTVIDGNDITLDTDEKEMLSQDLNDEIGSTKYINGYQMKVVGHFKFNGILENDKNYISSIELGKSDEDIMANSYVPENKLYILEGSYPTNTNEVLLPMMLKGKYSIGDSFKNHTVKGFYLHKDYELEDALYIKDEAAILKDSKAYYFRVNDLSKVSEALASYTFGTSKSILNDNNRNVMYSVIAVYGVMFIVLSSVSAVFIYFVMRSKMIADINVIGTYRCLGAKRNRICIKYTYDSFVQTALTLLIGYIIYMFLYFGLSNMVNSLTYTVLGINVLMTNWLIIIFGGLFVLLIGTLFGVLPVILLLRKTPSEIMSKYDI